MSNTLFQATLDLARVITNVVDGTATGGSDSTLVDTTFPFVSTSLAAPPDDHYNNGTLWILTCLNANKTAVITDWVQSSCTFSFNSLGKLVATGDLYAVCDRTYPLWLLRQAVNYALDEIGGVDTTDTSLSTIASTISYTLPSGVYNVKKVEVANQTSSPYTWTPRNNWHPVGSTIEFDSDMAGGYTIRLTYSVPPTTLTTDAGTFSDLINPELVKWVAAEYALTWRMRLTKNDEPAVKNDLVLALAKATAKANMYRAELHREPVANHYNVLGSF